MLGHDLPEPWLCLGLTWNPLVLLHSGSLWTRTPLPTILFPVFPQMDAQGSHFQSQFTCQVLRGALPPLLFQRLRPTPDLSPPLTLHFYPIAVFIIVPLHIHLLAISFSIQGSSTRKGTCTAGMQTALLQLALTLKPPSAWFCFSATFRTQTSPAQSLLFPVPFFLLTLQLPIWASVPYLINKSAPIKVLCGARSKDQLCVHLDLSTVFYSSITSLWSAALCRAPKRHSACFPPATDSSCSVSFADSPSWTWRWSIRAPQGSGVLLFPPSLCELFSMTEADYLQADDSQIYSILKHATLLFKILPVACFCACRFCFVLACPLPLEYKLREDRSHACCTSFFIFWSLAKRLAQDWLNLRVSQDPVINMEAQRLGTPGIVLFRLGDHDVPTLENPGKLGKFQTHPSQEESCPSPCLSRLILSLVLWSPFLPSSSDIQSPRF